MSETFKVQREREKQQDRQRERHGQRYKVLSHPVSPLQLDLGDLHQPPSAASLHQEPTLPKLEDTEDIEHFLRVFERQAELYQWPEEDWIMHLIPLLTSKAHGAFVELSPSKARNYVLVKEAMLKKYEITTETYRQRFRAMETLRDESPMELYNRLKDLFCKWVRFDTSDKNSIMETVVLEQYLRVLYPEVKKWVTEHDLSSAVEAARLVETFVATLQGPGAHRYSGVLNPSKGKSGGTGWCEDLQF